MSKVATAEQRKQPRTQCSRLVYIRVQAELVDISRTGARLSVDAPSKIPDIFMLEITSDVSRWCRVVWRRDRQIGVEYVATPKTEQ